ncbi:MAG: DUF885 domain-containing protein [Candidatus Zixiibacteriota bacterium]
MKRLLSILAIISIFAITSNAQSKLEKNFINLTDEILENLQTFFPVRASQNGIHEYDYKLPDYSNKAVSGEISKLNKFEVRLHKYSKSNLSGDNLVSLTLIKSEVDMALLDLQRIKWHRKNPYLYSSTAIDGIYYILTSEYAPLEMRAQNVIARMKVIPDLLNQAKNNLKNPPPIYIQLAQETTESGIEFFKTVEEELSRKLPELATEIGAATGMAIKAMQDYREFLNRLTPGDPNSFAIGKENFDYMLSNKYMLDYDSDSLLKIGEFQLEQVKKQYNDYLAGLSDSVEKTDSVFIIKCITKQDILNYYQWETEQTKQFIIENDLVTIPEGIGECKVIETPPFLTNMISTIAYQPPGTFSPSQTGYFFVRPIPDDMDDQQIEAKYRYIHRRGFKGSVVHEAYPGHHLQFQMAAKSNNNVRKWFGNAMYYEGWALYCEEMMYNAGFYGRDTRKYLNILGGVWFRAARIIVDVKLHTGAWTREEALDWFAKEMDADPSGWITTEIDRYTMTPTIQMSYLLGKIELLKLRDAFKAKEGENFSLKAFHDKFLAEIDVPPAMLWDIWGLEK